MEKSADALARSYFVLLMQVGLIYQVLIKEGILVVVDGWTTDPTVEFCCNAERKEQVVADRVVADKMVADKVVADKVVAVLEYRHFDQIY